MFKRILIANRGEIATRIVRACRELGVESVALFTASDQSSLHVRLADYGVQLSTARAFTDAAAIVQIAREQGADAIHPGYGFLAGRPELVAACSEAGITFIGPSAETASAVRDKVGALERVRAAGITTIQHSPAAYNPKEETALIEAADALGYPLIIKSKLGGRGYGQRMVTRPAGLIQMTRQARIEASAVYGDVDIYLEKVIQPAHQISVQVLGDHHGHLIHLGEREGSIIQRNQKILEESPAPCLTDTQRRGLWETALQVARLFHCTNACSVEFLADTEGNCYFTEVKPRIQVAHLLTEMVCQVDLVREQIRLAAGEPLNLSQAEVTPRGWAMVGCVHAKDPAGDGLLPSPGCLTSVRFPLGAGVRVDTYVYCQADVPADFDSLIAKVAAWGPNRAECLARLTAALRDTRLAGIPVNLSLLREVTQATPFIQGAYATDFFRHRQAIPLQSEEYYRDLAAIVALLHLRRNQMFVPALPERLGGQWHRSSRQLPQ